MVFLLCINILTACGAEEETVDTPEVEVVITEEMNSNFVPEDTSKEPEYHFAPAVLEFWVPDGFERSEESSQYLYYTYPKDVSYIDHLVLKSDIDTSNVTMSEYAASVEKDIKDAYGDEIKVTVTRFSKIVIDNRPGVWVEYNYDFRDDYFTALDIVIYNGDETHYMYYLQGPGAGWMNDFIKSANSIIVTDK